MADGGLTILWPGYGFEAAVRGLSVALSDGPEQLVAAR